MHGVLMGFWGLVSVKSVCMNLLQMAMQSCQKMANKEAGLFDYSEIFLVA